MRNITQGCGQEMNVAMDMCNISHNAQACAVREFIAMYTEMIKYSLGGKTEHAVCIKVHYDTAASCSKNTTSIWLVYC